MTIQQENQNLLRNGYPPLADIETLHTPGPWRLDWGKIVDQNDKAVCLLTPRRGAMNAHVIAAAPELLSALQQAYNAIAWDIPGGGLSDQEEEELLETIRAAIAKAEGRAE